MLIFLSSTLPDWLKTNKLQAVNDNSQITHLRMTRVKSNQHGRWEPRVTRAADRCEKRAGRWARRTTRVDFCPFLSEDTEEIDPLVSPESQDVRLQSDTNKKLNGSLLFFQSLPSIIHCEGRKKMLKMVARIAFKRKQLQFPLWNSRGHQKYALLPAPSSRVTWAAAGARRLVAEAGIAAAGATSAAVLAPAPTPSCLPSHHPGLAPGGSCHPRESSSPWKQRGRTSPLAEPLQPDNVL